MKIDSILNLITTVINSAEQARQAMDELEPLVRDLFAKGEISAERQDELLTWIEREKARVRAGDIPPHRQVEPDPGA